jgi:hypothetical protein
MRSRASRAAWEARVAEWRASGLTSEAYCEDKGFSAGALRHWSYRLGQAEREKAQAEKSGEVSVRVARVVCTPASKSGPDASAADVSRPCGVASHVLVVEIGAARIAVRPGFDQTTLSMVLETLTAVARSGR